MSDTQNDDLQNAINGIVNGAAGEAETPDLGAAPVPPMDGEGAPEVDLPAMAVPDPAAGLMNADPEAIEDQALDGPAPVEVPEPVDGTLSEAAINKLEDTMDKATSEISEVKRNMIADLIPLMDKVQVSPEKQFKLYKELIDATHESDLIPGAYAAAKRMTDETARAEALLYLIDESK